MMYERYQIKFKRLGLIKGTPPVSQGKNTQVRGGHTERLLGGRGWGGRGGGEGECVCVCVGGVLSSLLLTLLMP